eukprot:COSAG04_NODE_455_length_14087_cov_4.673935_11_plen_281_part_01
MLALHPCAPNFKVANIRSTVGFAFCSPPSAACASHPCWGAPPRPRPVSLRGCASLSTHEQLQPREVPMPHGVGVTAAHNLLWGRWPPARRGGPQIPHAAPRPSSPGQPPGPVRIPNGRGAGRVEKRTVVKSKPLIVDTRPARRGGLSANGSLDQNLDGTSSRQTLRLGSNTCRDRLGLVSGRLRDALLALLVPLLREVVEFEVAQHEVRQHCLHDTTLFQQEQTQRVVSNIGATYRDRGEHHHEPEGRAREELRRDAVEVSAREAKELGGAEDEEEPRGDS